MGALEPCSVESQRRGESLVATAPTLQRVLLVEHNGPWPSDAVAGSQMPEQVRRHLNGYDGRVLLIRRRHRPVGPVHVFAASPGRLVGTVLASLEQLPDTDPSTWPELDGPLYLVCTHGRRDACCARLGRPLVEHLAAQRPEETWEVSHLGGHRFAANLLVLPKGDLFGRVAPGDLFDVLGSGHGLRGNIWLSADEQAQAAYPGEDVCQLPSGEGRVSCRDVAPSPLTQWRGR